MAPTVPVVVAAAVVAVLAPTLGGRPLDRDEAAVLYSAHLSWHDLLAEARVQDGVFLVYDSLAHLVLGLGAGLVTLRALSLIGVALAAAFTGLAVARLLADRRNWLRLGLTLVATLLVALQPLLLIEYRNARPYGLAVGGAAVALYLLVRYIAERRRFLLLACASVAALVALLHLFAALPVLVGAVVALAWPPRDGVGRRRDRPGLVAAAVVAGLGVVPMALLALTQQGQLSWIPPLTPLTAARLVAAPVAVSPEFGFVQAVVLGLLALAALAVPGRRRLLVVVLLLWWLVPPLLLAFVSLHTPVQLARYVIAAVPGACALAAVSLGRLVSWLPRAASSAVAVAALVLVALQLNGAVLELEQPSTSDRFGQAAAFVEAHARDSDVLAAANHVTEAALAHAEETDGLRDWPDRHVERLEVFTPVAPHSVTPHSVAAERGPRRVWLVGYDNPYDRQAQARWLQAMRAAGYDVELRRHFDATDVTLLVRQT